MTVEACAVVHDAGAEPLQPGNLVVHRARGTQVKVQPVLGRLGFRNPVEPHVGSAPAGGFDKRLLDGGVLVDVGAEGCRPEPGQYERVCRIEAQT